MLSCASEESLKMQTIAQTIQTMQAIRCPNCGSPATRYYRSTQTQTECLECDYLMITCADTGNVVEAYAPGLAMRS